MDKKTNALKLALENAQPSFMAPGWTLVRNEDIAAIREALAESALERIAENERELGLDYMEPAQGCDYCNHPHYAGTKCKNCGREQPAQQDMPKIGCVNHDCDKCKAQQEEPCGWRMKHNGEWSYSFTEDAWDFIRRVPKAQQLEPTKAMIDAAERIDWSDADVRGNIVNMWQAMCAAAPQPAQQQEPVARVAEVHMSRYTLEWTNGPLPEGTALYSGPQPEQQQEPVAKSAADHKKGEIGFCEFLADVPNGSVLYTSPPASKPWVGLTDEEIAPVNEKYGFFDGFTGYARAIEAKLREKNAPNGITGEQK